MKIKLQYSLKMPDTASTKRHQHTLDVAKELVFEFPKLTEEIRALKRDPSTSNEYKEEKEKFFTTAAGKSSADWLKAFKDKTDANIKKAYDEKVKTFNQLNMKPDDWKKFLTEFAKTQVTVVERAFGDEIGKVKSVLETQIKALKEKVKAVVAIEEKNRPAIEACAAFIALHPLKFTVTIKFNDDHITSGTSRQSVEDLAVGRFLKNGVTTASFTELSEDTIKNKVSGGKKVAMVHNGAQQLCTAIKANVRTVRITEHTASAFKTGQLKNPREIGEAREKKYVTFTHTNAETTFCVVGKWSPLTGDAEIYHYEAKDAPAAYTMLPAYLKWYFDPKSNSFTAPVATK